MSWSLINSRRLGVQMAVAWNLGFDKPMRERYGVGISKTLVYFDGKKTEYYVDEKEFQKFNEGLQLLLKDTQFINSLVPEAKNLLENILQEYEKKFNNLDDLSDEQLKDLYKQFMQAQATFYSRMWMVYRISQPLTELVEQRLREKLGDEEKARQLTLTFSSPLKPNNVIEERLELLQLAIKKQQLTKQKFEQVLSLHARKYAYIPMYDFDHEPYAIQYFKQQLAEIKHPEQEKRKIEQTFVERKKQFEKELARLNADEELCQLLLFLSQVVFLRDYRDMLREKLNFHAKKFFEQLAKRKNISLRQATLLTSNETINSLNGANIPANLTEREQYFLLFQDEDTCNIFSGKQAFEKARQQLASNPQLDATQLKGTPASTGMVEGIVRIVLTNLDLPAVQQGEILVTSMTRQDFVPVMRKCAAIITDEGGVSCHAAIIAREFGLPCIVGIKNASKLLKNGSKIKVDADKGLVELLP